VESLVCHTVLGVYFGLLYALVLHPGKKNLKHFSPLALGDHRDSQTHCKNQLLLLDHNDCTKVFVTFR